MTEQDGSQLTAHVNALRHHRCGGGRATSMAAAPADGLVLGREALDAVRWDDAPRIDRRPLWWPVKVLEQRDRHAAAHRACAVRCALPSRLPTARASRVAVVRDLLSRTTCTVRSISSRRLHRSSVLPASAILMVRSGARIKSALMLHSCADPENLTHMRNGPAYRVTKVGPSGAAAAERPYRVARWHNRSRWFGLVFRLESPSLASSVATACEPSSSRSRGVFSAVLSRNLHSPREPCGMADRSRLTIVIASIHIFFTEDGAPVRSTRSTECAALRSHQSICHQCLQ
jgi:hypothetical protein